MSKKKTANKKIERIVKLVIDGKSDKALEIADVNDIGDLLGVGALFWQNEVYDVAEKIFDLIIRLNPNLVEAWYNKGVVLGNLGKYDEAVKCYDKAIKINPNHAEAWSNKGTALGNLGRYDDAVKCHDEAIKINSNLAEAWSNKGAALGNLGRDDEAVECYDKAIEINPNYAEAWSNKGNAQGDLGRYDEAVKCHDKAIEINPNLAGAWYNKGAAQGDLGRYDEAVKCYDEAIKINPNYAEAWSNKGNALGDLGRPDEAVKCYDKAIEINPNLAEAWSNKGVALGNLGRYDGAVECYDEAIEINPDLAVAWYGKGAALGNLGRYDEAIKCYDKAIEINPNHAEAYGNKGIAFLNVRKYDEAKAELRKAKSIFSMRGMKEDGDKMHGLESLAANASRLISRMIPLDQRFINSSNSQSLTELREETLEISRGMESVIKEFLNEEIPGDVGELLISKAICFSALSSALKFDKENVDKVALAKAKTVFEKWGLDQFATAVNSIDTLIRFLDKYDCLENIPKKEEEYLLGVLSASYVLGGKLTDEITDKIRAKPFKAKTIGAGMGKKPEIIHKHIADTEKEWVTFCLVQMDFSIEEQGPPREFAWVLTKKDEIKNKVFKALEIARRNNVDVICFPELSFVKEWIQEIENEYNEMIIIGGSYYDGGYNVCPIIIDGKSIEPPYKKHKYSPSENPETTGRGMKSGNILYTLQTRCGRFSVLTCIDYADQSYRICKGDKPVDFIINPCYDPNILRPQSRCNSDCQDYEIDVIQVNKAPEDGKYGGTCIIGKEHKILLDRLRNNRLKPEDDIKYKLCQADGEMMIIADLNIKMKAPPVDLPVGYEGRIKTPKERWYKYEREDWSPLSN